MICKHHRLTDGCRAEFPLQWLGEHLIEQSILFEGNPDSTRLRERFRYNHDSAAAAKQTPSQPPIVQTAPSASIPSAAVLEPAQEPQAIKAEEMETQPAAVIAQTPISVSTSEQQNGPADTQEPTMVAISNTITTEPPEAKDTEMSNAT